MPSTLAKKFRTLAIGAVAAAALAAPAALTLSVSAHAVGKAPIARPASHRLALNVNPASLRLT